ncbi:LAMI_0E12398g1_1 [Lachancea mirantina]|uniref:LAMI_0E12398g1_1 n=1 Tax=Lachancea mirantina TaxID=1230905 RepID=A0A1G4JQ44_9SACH|nr:LAMI_0E12398g1_1 [Lachancea mirantina]
MAQEYKVSTGRGGAGNVAVTSDKPVPKMVPQGSQTPSILQPVFSTGRGGAGNMRKNVDSKMTRKAQDVEYSENEDLITEGNVDAIDSRGSRGGSLKAKNSEGLKTKRSRPDPPKTVVIGRGGAGNILSPASSRKSKSNKNEKKGLWKKIKSVFSSS